MLKRKILLLACVAVLAACGGNKNKQKVEVTGTPESMYNSGMKAMYAKNFPKAINIFEELDRQNPYSEYSKKGQIMIMFAKFENRDFDEAIFLADAFIKENIRYEDLDYVYYIKGLSDYVRISNPDRDQGHTKSALESFEALINRFPESKYAKEAKQKIILCLNHLAAKEMEIGRFYQSSGRMLAAINRFQVVVNYYERSSQTPEALYRIAEAYTALGINSEAVKALSILGYNYSGQSKWYQKGYQLLTNIKDHEEKFQNEAWYKKFSKGVQESFED